MTKKAHASRFTPHELSFNPVALMIVVEQPGNDGTNFNGLWQVGFHGDGRGAASVQHVLGATHPLEPILPYFAVRRP